MGFILLFLAALAPGAVAGDVGAVVAGWESLVLQFGVAGLVAALGGKVALMLYTDKERAQAEHFDVQLKMTERLVTATEKSNDALRDLAEACREQTRVLTSQHERLHEAVRARQGLRSVPSRPSPSPSTDRAAP